MTRLAISIGCPGGIGPEVALAACARSPKDLRLILFGDLALLRERAACVAFDAPRLVGIASARDATSLAPGAIAVVEQARKLTEPERRPGAPTAAGGAAQLAWIDAATDAVVAGDADALVTGPVSKAAIASSGAAGSAEFLGHTEHLGRRLQAPETVMAFVSSALTISLVTTHLPIEAVAVSITRGSVATASYWTVRLVDALDIEPSLPLAVLSLNPHAGESGLLGSDEPRAIIPGIKQAVERLQLEHRTRSIVGPIPAEAAIRQAVRDHRYAACVAMYHDQATIPMKLLAFGDAVNVTLGLPIVRTSVDHGTAYDLAGTGRADCSGMTAAIELAVKLARRGI